MASQKTLDGDEKISTDNAMVGGKEIHAVTDGEDVESVLGWMTWYTFGSGDVDRKWLEERASELGIPESWLPSPVTPRRAFTRASKMLVSETAGIIPEDVEANTERSKTDNKVFFLELIDRREGVENSTSEVIGKLEYESGDENVYTRAKTSHPEYIEWFQMYAEEFKNLFDLYSRSNRIKEVRKAFRDRFLKLETTSVTMRPAGAVYFVPAHYQEGFEAYRELVADIDRLWKDEGYECTVDTVEVIDSPEKREMVEKKVRNSLEEAVEGIVEEAIDSFDEDRAANEVVSELGKELSKAENLAVEHNTLLNAEMSVRSALESWKSSVEEDEEELITKMVEKVDV